MAELLGLPVLLVVDAYGMAESAGAVVKGFLEYGGERRPLIKGVFFNRVGSERHFKHLSKGISIPVIGFLPKDNDIEIPHRHLGLVTSEERPISEDGIRKLAELFIENTDIKHLIEDGFSEYKRRKPLRHVKAVRKDLKIGVAYDEAFSFYYEDNLDLLQHCGAEIVYFSPIRDRKIPEGVDGLYIGGGYPELYAQELSVNLEMKNSIREFVDDGGVVYAECGGFIYLSEGIETEDGKFHEMAGIFPCSIRYSDRLKALGYREVTVKRECIIGKKGMRGRGHEFRYTEISKLTGEMINVYDGKAGGYQVKNCLSSYIHLHFMSNPEIAANLVDFIRRNNEQG
ncbi:MAG: cobyrinate a,c-diamide synthase [Nitrospirae bacterium]|nr:MAG: cobyrinate a,c-diamide synthase [Nitrospirota bacterium]